MVRSSLLLYGLLICACHTGYSQKLFSGEATITVNPNTTLSVDGGVENGGTIINNGLLQVSGRWINSGTYHAGKGTIAFNGNSTTVPQVIHHNGQSFSRVIISGSARKIFISDVVVSGHIHFQQGILEAAASAKMVFDDGVQISGASDSSHVHGRLYHKGSGSKLFPLGNGTLYLPVELPEVASPTAYIGIQAFEPENSALTAHRSLASIFGGRYWYIDVLGPPPGSRVVLPLRDASGPVDLDKLVVAQSSAASNEFTSIGKSSLQGSLGQGTVASSFEVTMPFVALATTATDAPLIVYNAVSPNGDNINDYLRIENIGMHPENKLTLFNRWGDKVFEIENYDNEERVFKGRSTTGDEKQLVSGTYFYSLETSTGMKLTGFLVLKN